MGAGADGDLAGFPQLFGYNRRETVHLQWFSHLVRDCASAGHESVTIVWSSRIKWLNVSRTPHTCSHRDQFGD
jgi:hypothetical protein